jgi:hypothetical protein
LGSRRAFLPLWTGQSILEHREPHPDLGLHRGAQHHDLGAQLRDDPICFGITRAQLRVTQLQRARPAPLQFIDDESACVENDVRQKVGRRRVVYILQIA